MTASRHSLDETLETFLQRLMSTVHSEGLDQLVELDLSMTQARTMFCVAQAGSLLSIGEIGERIGLSLAAAGRTVDSLVRLGTLERQENPDDRRVKLVGLTKRGFAAVDEQFAHKRRALRTFVEQLPETDAQDLDRVLRQILAGDALREPQEEKS